MSRTIWTWVTLGVISATFTLSIPALAGDLRGNLPVLLAQANTSGPQPAPDGGNPASANGYIQHAAIGDLFEIESSKLALTRSNNDQVRHFAQMMIDAHEKSTALLKEQIGQEATKIVLPTKLDQEHLALLDGLKTKTGNDFDQAYANVQLTAHQQALKIHQDYLSQGADPLLQDAAKQIVPVVQQHLTEATKLQQSIQKQAETTN